IALTLDNRFLVAVDDQFLRIWDLAAGKERRCWPLPDTATDYLENIAVARLLLFAGGRRAFTTLADGTALVWDLAPTMETAAPLAQNAGDKEIAAWWADLAGDDARRAYAAVWRLAEAPRKPVVAFLRQYLRPATDANLEQARQLIRELDSNQFDVREKAFR